MKIVWQEIYDPTEKIFKNVIFCCELIKYNLK